MGSLKLGNVWVFCSADSQAEKDQKAAVQKQHCLLGLPINSVRKPVKTWEYFSPHCVLFFSSTCASFPQSGHSSPDCSGTRRTGRTRTSPSASHCPRTVTSSSWPSNGCIPHCSVISTIFSPSPSVQDLTFTSLRRDPTGVMKRNSVVRNLESLKGARLPYMMSKEFSVENCVYF